MFFPSISISLCIVNPSQFWCFQEVRGTHETSLLVLSLWSVNVFDNDKEIC